MRLIDAEPFDFNKVVIPDGGPNFMRGYGLGAKHVCDEIDAAPTIEAVPVVHGYWELNHEKEWCCSACGYAPVVHEGSNYCGCCGAKMDLEGTDADKT